MQAPARVTTTTLQAPSKLLRAKDGLVTPKAVRTRTQVWIQRRSDRLFVGTRSLARMTSSRELLLDMAMSPLMSLAGCVSVMSASANGPKTKPTRAAHDPP